MCLGRGAITLCITIIGMEHGMAGMIDWPVRLHRLRRRLAGDRTAWMCSYVAQRTQSGIQPGMEHGIPWKRWVALSALDQLLPPGQRDAWMCFVLVPIAHSIITIGMATGMVGTIDLRKKCLVIP